MMPPTNAPMMLEGSEQVATAAPTADAPKDTDGIPYCRECHCRMKVTSSGPKGSRKKQYGCPVPGCKGTGRTIKTQVETVVPSAPLACPRCSTDKKPIFCKRSERLSTAGMVILECPECSWKSSAMATPELAAMQIARRADKRPAEEAIGDR